LIGNNVISTKGAIHYLNTQEINENKNYLSNKIKSEKEIVALILGGPNNYYKYTKRNIENIFLKINENFIKNNFQLIVIPSIRTPKDIIKFANEYYGKDHLVINEVDKRAYLSALGLSKFIVVTCDSSSMISEAAITGKPIYVAGIPASKDDHRFRKFISLFKELNIIRVLDSKIENWEYENLDETNRVAKEIKNKF
jgi:mitochondrial fission protein ELM1